MKKILILSAVILGSLYYLSCNKDEETAGTTPFFVRMTDAPATVYDSVIIDLQAVEVKNDNGATIMLNTTAGLYDLLDYTNGRDTLIASATLPSSTVSQVRLILGSNNYVVIGGVQFPLKTPSAQQSGLKLNVHAPLVPGVAYILKLDFDAATSIVTTGNGDYILKPVIHVVATGTAGSITGIVTPVGALPATVTASNLNGTYGATAVATTNPIGQFLIGGVAAGTYTVIIVPQAPFLNDTINNVNVSVGAMTDLGTIIL